MYPSKMKAKKQRKARPLDFMRAKTPPKDIQRHQRAERKDHCSSCDAPINPLTGECAGCTGT